MPSKIGIQWPKLEEVKRATTKDLQEWVELLPKPKTKEHILIREAILNEYVERIR